MDSPVTLRLESETRHQIASIARAKHVSASEVIREANATLVRKYEIDSSPYEGMADLFGIGHGGNPKRSNGAGRQFSALLKRRGKRH